MKTFLRHDHGSTLGRGRASFAVVALLALGAFALARPGSDSPASGGGGVPSTGWGGFGAGGGDDETIGTLPAYYGGPTFDLVRSARTNRPLLFVQGTVDQVLSSAISLRGDHHVLAQVVQGGQLRLTFLGEAEIAFDRGMFHVAGLKVGVAIPDSSPILRTFAAWNGQSIGPLWSYVYELPVAQFEANGLLDQAPVLAGVATAHGVSIVRAQASADLVTLTQRQ